MEPILIAAFELANTIAKIVLLEMESQPPEVRAELARMHFEDLKRFREFLERFRPEP